MPAELKWQCVPMTDLSAETLYDVLKLRADVFIVEQTCIWTELDGYDKQSLHLFGQNESSTDIIAYARIVPAYTKGETQPMPLISRVVTAPAARGTGLGRVLMQQAIDNCASHWPDATIEIGAQARLESFYASMGFQTSSDPYDEDGIMHINMIRPCLKQDVSSSIW